MSATYVRIQLYVYHDRIFYNVYTTREFVVIQKPNSDQLLVLNCNELFAQQFQLQDSEDNLLL